MENNDKIPINSSKALVPSRDGTNVCMLAKVGNGRLAMCGRQRGHAGGKNQDF